MLAPESMQETFMSDSEDEGGRFKSLGRLLLGFRIRLDGTETEELMQHNVEQFKTSI